MFYYLDMKSPDAQCGRQFNSGLSSDLVFRANVNRAMDEFFARFSGLREHFSTAQPTQSKFGDDGNIAVFIPNRLAGTIKSCGLTEVQDMAESGIYVLLLEFAMVHRIYVLCKFDDGEIGDLNVRGDSRLVNFGRFCGAPEGTARWAYKIAESSQFL